MKIITIKDYYGNYQEVPVDDALYAEWQELQRESDRIRKKEVYHRDWMPIEEAENDILANTDDVLEHILQEEEIIRLYAAIKMLTPVQQKRIEMFLKDMSYTDIARAEGVITLYNSITSKCNSQFDRLLEDCDIDEVIRSEPTMLPGEVQLLIRSMADEFLNEFYNFLREHGIDVRTSKCVFAGGGSILLRSMIERGGKVAFPVFIDDIHANAVGYMLLYQSEVKANGR